MQARTLLHKHMLQYGGVYTCPAWHCRQFNSLDIEKLPQTKSFSLNQVSALFWPFSLVILHLVKHFTLRIKSIIWKLSFEGMIAFIIHLINN